MRIIDQLYLIFEFLQITIYKSGQFFKQISAHNYILVKTTGFIQNLIK